MKRIVSRSEHHRLGVLHEAIVLGMEDVMDCGQSDIFVGTPVTRHIVRVEEFVVVVAWLEAGVVEADLDIAVGKAIGHGVVRDVGKECVASQDGVRRQRTPSPPLAAGLPSTRPVVVTICGKPLAPRMKLP